MDISLASIKRGTPSKPPLTMVYGTHGIGKTSFAASAPSPIFLQTEDGLGEIDAPTFGLLRTYDEIMQAIGVLYNDEHDFKTVVLDSADHLEPLVWAQACKDNGWKSIEDPGYGKGYVAAYDLWRVLIDGLRALRDERAMSVIIIAHSAVQRFDAPDTEPYDRYVVKLHKGASALLQEAMDCVLFAHYRISTVKSDVGFGQKKTRAVGGGDRVLYTEERPAYLAKQRYSLPAVVPMEWNAVASAIPYFNQQQAA